MMPNEFEEFSEALKVLESVFGKKADDCLVRLYWTALRDLPLEAVKSGIARHVRYGKFFPKPAELRRADDKPRSDLTLSADARRSTHIALIELAEQDAANGYLRGALALNASTWRERRAEDPELGELEYRLARVGRILAVDPPDSPQYAEAVEADRRLRTEREALLEARYGREAA